MKKGWIVVLLILLLSSSLAVSAQTERAFSDIPSTYWAWAEIQSLVQENVVQGYPDGTFRPEMPVTRAEFAKMIVAALPLPLVQGGVPSFPDVSPDHWAFALIESAATAGLLKGYPDGNFQPEKSVSKAELLTILMRSQDFKLSAGETPFPDVPSSHWSSTAVLACMQNNILMDPDPQIVVAGLLQPDQAASRGQTAVLLARAIDPAFRQAQWSMWGRDSQHSQRFPLACSNLQPSWSFTLPGIGSAPTIAADGTIYCTTYQWVTAYKANGMLVAVRPDGTEAWSISLPMAAPTTPALGKQNRIYLTAANTLLAYTVNGQKLWQLPIKYQAGARPLNLSPVVLGPESIYFVHMSSLYAVSFEGEILWQRDLNLFPSEEPLPPTLDEEGNIYLISETTQELLSLTWQGDLRWKTALKYPPSFTTPPMIGPDGTVYCLSSPGKKDEANIEVFSSEGSRIWDLEEMDGNVIKVRSLALGSDGLLRAIGSERIFVFRPDGQVVLSQSVEKEARSPIVMAQQTAYWVGVAPEDSSYTLYQMNKDGVIRTLGSFGQIEDPLQTAGELALALNGTLYAVSGEQLQAWASIGDSP